MRKASEDLLSSSIAPTAPVIESEKTQEKILLKNFYDSDDDLMAFYVFEANKIKNQLDALTPEWWDCPEI